MDENQDTSYWTPIEPTMPVANPYDDGYERGIPPPPPHISHKKHSPALLVMLLVSAISLFGASGLFYLARIYAVDHSKPTPVVIVATPTATPYTAQNIVNAFLDHNLRVDEIRQGETVSNWMFEVSISPLALSSEQFDDNLACGGPCADAPPRYGIWVYATSPDAQRVYQEVVQDLPNLFVSYPAAYQWKWYAATYADNGQVASYNVQAHGCCLLLGANASSQYTHVMQQYCV